jgi:transcriptional regulator with XRE-family HTH domain
VSRYSVRFANSREITMTKSPPLPFHLRLKQQREEHRLSQREVAEALGVSQAIYSHWETGRRPMPKERLKALPKAFKVARAAHDGCIATRTKLALAHYERNAKK